MKNCSPWGVLLLEKFKNDCFLWELPQGGAGEECEEGGPSEAKCDELVTTLIPCPPVLLWGEELEQ